MDQFTGDPKGRRRVEKLTALPKALGDGMTPCPLVEPGEPVFGGNQDRQQRRIERIRDLISHFESKALAVKRKVTRAFVPAQLFEGFPPLLCSAHICSPHAVHEDACAPAALILRPA